MTPPKEQTPPTERMFRRIVTERLKKIPPQMIPQLWTYWQILISRYLDKPSDPAPGPIAPKLKPVRKRPRLRLIEGGKKSKGGSGEHERDI
jgi:hypothetical protein